MVEWFKSLPKTMFVAVVLTGGVLFIVLSDPPKTLCDARMKAFQESTKGFLLPDPLKPRKPRFDKLLEICKKTNSSGGCYELFISLREMVKSSILTGPECYRKLSGRAEVKATLNQSLDFFARSAWGAEPPVSSAYKAGWMDPSDINLFCQLKGLMIDLYGQPAWDEFGRSYFQSLPKASTFPREGAWGRMIFSVNCASYL